MKILFFSNNYGPISFITNQIEQISESHEVLYLATEVTKRSQNFQVEKIEFHYPLITKKIRDRLEMHQIYLTFRNAQFKRKLVDAIAKFNPDIIHLNFGYEALKFLDNYKLKDTTPVIIHFRGYDASQLLKNRSYVARLKNILSKPNVFSIAVCKHLIENLYKEKIEFKNTPKVLYSNTDTTFFKRSKSIKLDHNFRLIQISSFREKKGHSFTIQALRNYIDKTGDHKITLQLVGLPAGPQYEKSVFLSQQLNLQNNIEFLGQKSQIEIRELLENAHCAVLHSITPENGDQEGIPNAIMEAMSMELPIISTYHAGIPELLSPETFSIMVDERDVEAYSEAIAKIKDDWSLSLLNRKRIEQRFSKEQFILSLNQIYTNLIQK